MVQTHFARKMSKFLHVLCVLENYSNRKPLKIYVLLLVADADECESSETNECASNALCTNTEGSYVCRCLKGYEGDGRNCTGKHSYGVSIFRLKLHMSNVNPLFGSYCTWLFSIVWFKRILPGRCRSSCMCFVFLKITVTVNFSKLMFFFWLQTQMNAKALKQMSVTPMPFVPTLKDPMCVVV